MPLADRYRVKLPGQRNQMHNRIEKLLQQARANAALESFRLSAAAAEKLKVITASAAFGRSSIVSLGT